MADPRMDNLRVALYPCTRAERGEAPTGVHRPDVVVSLERTLLSPEAHETITRAFKLFTRRKRTLREEEMHRKLECMKAALSELERERPAWYHTAEVKRTRLRLENIEVEARSIEGIFPHDLRVRVDTPPRDGWQW